MKTNFTPASATFLYAEAVATGSVGMDTMMSGFLVITVSRSETCLSGLKLASVVATISMPSLSNCALSPAIWALAQSLPP